MFGWSDVQTRQNTVRLLVILAVILSILGFICGMAFAVKSSGFMFVVCLIPAGILWWRFYVNLKSYKEMYKELVVKKAAEGMFDNFQYSPKVGFDREEIRETGIMNMGNRYNSEDMVDGSYKGVTFRRADMYIAEHHQSGKNSYTIVFLRGTWLSFTYNKRFLTDVQIMSNDFHHGRPPSQIRDRGHDLQPSVHMHVPERCGSILPSDAAGDADVTAVKERVRMPVYGGICE